MKITPSQLRKYLVKAIAIFGMSIPMYGMFVGQPAMAQKSKHHHNYPTYIPTQNKIPTYNTTMERFFFQYNYTSPPIINGIAIPQSYIGSGYGSVGTYHMGQTIPVFDSATGLKQIGVYTIGKVDDTLPYDAGQINHLTISEYDWGNNHLIQGTGLGTSGGMNLGSESGTLIGRGLEGSNVFFSNQNPAIVQYHF